MLDGFVAPWSYLAAACWNSFSPCTSWRYGDFADLLAPFHAEQCVNAGQEVLGETKWMNCA